MKNCPFCAEEIQDAAAKCRFCGEWLDSGRNGSSAMADRAATVQPSDQSGPRRHRRRAWLFSAIVLGLILAVVASMLALNKPSAKARADKALPPGPPGHVTAAPAAFSVTLSWYPPSDGSNVNEYRIYRDGVLLGKVPVSASQYIDKTSLPLQLYNYAVESVSSEGAVSPKAETQTRTKAGPMSLARVSGRFQWDNSQTVSQTPGTTSIPSLIDAGWEFTPICASGPCALEWQGFLVLRGYPGFSIDSKTTRLNASYQATAPITFQCSGAPYIETARLQFRVVKAATLDGDWRATQVAGKLTYTASAQGGCGGLQTIYSFKASLLPDAAESVVTVLGSGCGGVLGTGFIAAKGYVVTNAHVVAGEGAGSVKVVERDQTHGATVVLFDPKRDIAVLRVKGLTGPILTLSDSPSPVGKRADIVGFPLGVLGDLKARILKTSSRSPDIFGHGVARRGYLLKASTDHGSSGSPIVSADGSVVGVIWGGTGHGLSSAVASGEVMPLLKRALGKTRAVGTGSCLH